MDLVETITTIIRRKQSAGETSVWLNDANLSALKRTPMGVVCNPPAPTAPAPAAPVSAPPPIPAAPPVPAAAPAEATVSWPAPPDVGSAEWPELEAACRSCQCCPLCRLGRHTIVVEDGSRQAELMFIGEGPGEEEDRQGVPFVGRAGQLLTRMIAAMGRRRDAAAPPAEAVYIANVVKCRPPGNRNPEPQEAQACLGYLRRQIALVRPKAIVLLGNVPLQALMGLSGITRHRGKWLDYGGIPVMPTFHPAYLLRFERFPAQFIQNKRLVWSDLQAVMGRLKPPPA